MQRAFFGETGLFKSEFSSILFKLKVKIYLLEIILVLLSQQNDLFLFGRDLFVESNFVPLCVLPPTLSTLFNLG